MPMVENGSRYALTCPEPFDIGTSWQQRGIEKIRYSMNGRGPESAGSVLFTLNYAGLNHYTCAALYTLHGTA